MGQKPKQAWDRQPVQCGGTVLPLGNWVSGLTVESEAGRKALGDQGGTYAPGNQHSAQKPRVPPPTAYLPQTPYRQAQTRLVPLNR